MRQEREQGISNEPDRLQSRVLVVLLTTALLALAGWRLGHWRAFPQPSLATLVVPSAGFALLVWALRAATPAAALAGGLISLLLCCAGAQASPDSRTGSLLHSGLLHSGLPPLVVLFLLTFLASRAGRAFATATERRHGRRASQVLANLGVAGLAAGWHDTSGLPHLLLLAALAEAAADTVSSEIGQAFGGRPWLGLRQVEPGTDGAVSALGTVAGIAAATVVALAGAWSLRLSLHATAIAACAGIFGLGFDSLLGATVERRGWLGNDLVNFLSTAAAALSAAALDRLA